MGAQSKVQRVARLLEVFKYSDNRPTKDIEDLNFILQLLDEIDRDLTDFWLDMKAQGAYEDFSSL